MLPIAKASCGFELSTRAMSAHFLTAAFAIIACLSMMPAAAAAQQASQNGPDAVTIRGTVHHAAGGPVENALVRMEQKGVAGTTDAKTDAVGAFVFSPLQTGTYVLRAEKSGVQSRASAVIAAVQGDQKQVDLILEDAETVQAESQATSPSSSQAMEFADNPNFTIAGVTDWTAAGGHGSDSTLRTSEALTRETLTLKSGPGANAPVIGGRGSVGSESERELRAALAAAPTSSEANRQLGEFYLRAGRYVDSLPLLQAAFQFNPTNQEIEADLALACKGAGDFSRAREHVQHLLALKESADLHRLAGELDEKLSDPLAAIHEFEQAVRMAPNEQNYLEWGSELLLHRAVWQAQEVFAKGALAYPKSVRMLTALGTALFSSALYDQAALRLCDASDLNPTDPEPYEFLGKIEMASPDPLTCVEQKLARFVREQPDNALANYFYAMAIWKQQQQSPDPQALLKMEALLTKAVTLDAKCADAYLQLGILNSSRRSFPQAIDYYTRAIAANPELAEAYYRLGVAYDRIGDAEKAKQQFQLHDEIRKKQAAAVDRERRAVKQFLVAKPQPSADATH